jgi:lipoprotein-releasing system ATP-binding protein
MNDYIIEIRDLHKTYKNGIQNLKVLKGINLKIKRGQLFCIQGPSGAGKSTLLNIIGTLDLPTKGEVLFDETNIHRWRENKVAEFRNKRLGFVFQFYHLLSEFTALENVMLPALMKNFWHRREVMVYAEKIFKDLGLTERMNFMPSQLSGGEQQRVAIARALINQPDIILCDEPTGNLDSDNGQKILNILKDLCRERNTTVALVTHNKEIAEVCDTVVHLKDGLLQ